MKKQFMILLLALILCFMVGCQNKEAMAELEKFRAQAALEEQNKALIIRLNDELNKGNIEIINELYASDYVYYIPSRSTNPMSREETLEMTQNVYRVFPDIHVSLEELIAVGDRVILRYISRGTHKEEWEGILPTGNKIEVSGIIISRIENGKFVEDWQEMDTFDLIMQLGMELKPKEEKK
jgi:predicted ester cyclase